MTPRMENVIALLLLVLLSWAKSAPTHAHTHGKPGHVATESSRSARRVERTSGSCESIADCAWGYTCGGLCVEAGCHSARRIAGRRIAARTCGEGATCAYEDGTSAAHGAGYCEASR